MRKTAVLILLLTLVFTVSCGKGGDEDGKSTDKAYTSETYTLNTEVLDMDEAVPYEEVRIVRADKASDFEKDAAVSIHKAILALGGKVNLVTDWTAPTDILEIIVGNTNRGTSGDLRLGEYRIYREGNKIFIFGGDFDGLTSGAKYFCENLLSSEGLLVPDGYSLIKKADKVIDCITFSGDKIESVHIFADDYTKTYAQTIADAIKEKAGITADTTSVKADSNILFVTSDESIPDSEWGLVSREGKLYIAAKNGLETELAYKYLMVLIENARGTLAFDGLVHSEKLISEEEARNMKNFVIYPEFPSQIRRIYDYDVTVTMGSRTEKIPVYNHVVESNVSRRPGVDMYRRFSMFAFSGESVRVDIKVKTDFTNYTVFPSSKNFRHDFKDGVISVYLDKPDYFGILLDDDQNTILSVLADYPEYEASIPDRNDPDVMWIEGWQEVEGGILTINKPNTTIYIQAGSVLNARTHITADNCKILGRGAIVDPFENIYEYDIREGGTEGTGVRPVTINASNCTVDGITIIDARCFNITCYQKNNTIRNVKEFSSMMTTDGITAGGSGHLFEHIWLYVGDDAIVCYARDTTFRDIAIGTTCSAMFPQSDPQNILFENINVFRADDGVIHNYFANKIYDNDFESITYNGLYALEMPDVMTHFFLGRNRATGEKNFTFNNVSIGNFSDTLIFQNGSGYNFTENYKMKFNNLSIGGKVITSESEIPTKNPGNAKNYIEVTCDSDYKPHLRNMKTVNYTAKDKVYIGARQVFFDKKIKRENGKIMLPTEEICNLLRFKKQGSSEHISTDELLSANMISSAQDKHGNIYLIPVYNGKNLLLPDEGEISYFAEQICYQLDLVTSEDRDGIIYTVYGNKAKGVGAGISRRITDEIRMYGEGTYRVTFSAKACTDGSLKLGYENDSIIAANTFAVSTEWKNYSFHLKVDAYAIGATKCVIRFTGDETVLDNFSLRDFSLTKEK